MATVDKVLGWLWSHLDDRQRNVLAGRFGITESGDANTLAEIGKKYGITRERVRQIEAGALDILKEKAAGSAAFGEFVDGGEKYLRNSGGVVRRDYFLDHHKDLFEDINGNHLDLFVEMSERFRFHPEDKEFWPFYYADDGSFDNARNFIVDWEKFLKARREEILSSQSYRPHFKVFVKKWRINPVHAESYVAISKKFHTNNFGDSGLAEWPEIKPVTIRDHIYLILKKEKKPIHFVDIAKLIGERSKGKSALSATVHNELIKDKRFVLVGRGVYGLAENGYRPGTAREVIQRIIRENGPLRTREIVFAVQKERLFKSNTVLVNLQNKKYFLRQPDGTYLMRHK